MSYEQEKYSDDLKSAPPPPSTGIPVTQQYLVPARTEEVPWSTGLFGCFDDVPNCCITFWCPCITFGQISEIVDKGSSSCGLNGALYTLIACVTGCACFYSCFYRSKMRQQYALHESPCGDCLVHCFCESCALCQEYRELKNRGFEVPLGWLGNIERQNRGINMAPMMDVGINHNTINGDQDFNTITRLKDTRLKDTLKHNTRLKGDCIDSQDNQGDETTHENII